MSLIGAEFYLELHGLLCRSEILGSSATFARDEIRFRIDLPTAPDSFSFNYMHPVASDASSPDPREYNPSLVLIDHGQDLKEVRVIRVVANTDSALCADTFDYNDEDNQTAHNQLLDRLRAASLQLVRDFTERFAFDLRQSSTEPVGRYPRIVNVHSLVDISCQRPFGITIGMSSFNVVAPEVVADADSFRRITASLQQVGSLGPDEAMLAEARHVVQGEQPAAPQRATLLAAIALELRTKRALRSLADENRAPLVQLLLDNPRDWSMSAHGLFGKALPLLVETVDPDDRHRKLSKRVQALFSARNAIAHRGTLVNLTAAQQYVETADLAFEYIGELETLTPVKRDLGRGEIDRPT